MDPKVTNITLQQPLAMIDWLGKSLWNGVFHSLAEYRVHCIIHWPRAHGRLRGELTGACDTSKCLEHNVCFLNHHPIDLPFSLGKKDSQNKHRNVVTVDKSDNERVLFVFRNFSLQCRLHSPSFLSTLWRTQWRWPLRTKQVFKDLSGRS